MVQHLEETSGTHYDSTRNYNNGTPENGVTQDASGKINGADYFDGVDDYVKVPDSSSLDITDAVTIEAWINSPDFKNQYPGIACKWDWSSTNPQRSYSLYLMDYTKPCVMTSENGTYLDQLVSTKELSTNTWYHLTGVSTGSKWILYINGELDCEKVIVTTIHSGTAKFSIGASMKDGSVAADETFKGTIDEVRVSNVARSSGWISTSYNNENSPSTFYSIGSEETAIVKYQVKFDQTGLDNTATGTVVTVNGLPLTRENLPYIILVDNGTVVNYSYSSTVSSTVIGKQFIENNVTGNPSPITVNGPENVTGNYVTQYKLTMATNFGTTSPSAGDTWENENAVVDISATPPSAGAGENYLFSGWTGTGTDNYTGPNQSASVTMNGPITETASWTHRYYLTVTSPYGTTGGEGWYDNGATANATVTPLTVSGPTGVQYVFTNWSGDATGTTSPSDPITMNAPKTAIANWKTQYYLTVVTSPSGVNSPTGEGWYDVGASAPISTDNLVDIISGSSRYRFDSWTTDNMDEILSPSSTSTSVKMDSAKTVTANYVMQYFLTFQQSGLSSDAAGTVLTVGATNYTYSSFSVTIWVDNGTTYSYTSMVPAGAGKQYVLTGVSGPASSITSSGTVTGTYKTVERFTLQLLAGWNLVGFPLENENATPSNLFAGTTYTMYYWASGGYAIPPKKSPVQDNLGYWVNVDENTTITYSGIRSSDTPGGGSKTMHFLAGWNLVCFPWTSENTTPANLFAGTTYTMYYWASGGYAIPPKKSPVQDNLGYWVNVPQDWTVTVPL
jgi:hypothetical protein